MPYGPGMLTPALRPWLFAALVTLAAAPALAQPRPQPQQQKPAQPQEVLEFETVNSYALNLNEVGSGWGLVSTYPAAFKVGLEAAPDLGGSDVVYIKAGASGKYVQGDLMQTIEAAALGGKRIRTTARIKNQGDGFAVFSAETFSGDGRVLSTVHHMLALNSNWQQQELILDVPPGASRLDIGVSLSGNEGSAIWIDRATLEVSGEKR